MSGYASSDKAAKTPGGQSVIQTYPTEGLHKIPLNSTITYPYIVDFKAMLLRIQTFVAQT